MSPVAVPAEVRFWQKVNKTSTCWRWTGSMFPNGYGHLAVKRASVMAHRYSYELLVGPIPDGLVIDHLCRNRACVNPDHLEPVTVRVNNHRGIGPTARRAAQTRCTNGHPFTPENTYLKPNGCRDCRDCKRARNARAAARRSIRLTDHGRDVVEVGRLLLALLLTLALAGAVDGWVR